MGTYKVFNGTDWVNICDCQVNIRNASNNWQLLDPTNCLTKYWTGTEWCEITCVQPCECIDGEIVIGTQTWTCQNLNVDTYKNGDPIPEVQDPNVWANLTTGAWCYYNNDPANGPIHGKIYNFAAVQDPRGLGPIGWHVPSDAEWTILTNYLGGLMGNGGKMKTPGLTYWNPPNLGATNSTCFTGIASGGRRSDGLFTNMRDTGIWWTTTGSIDPYYYWLNTYNNDIMRFNNNGNKIGNSVRLIRD